MKFLFDKNGVEAVNVAMVRKFYVEQMVFKDGESMACVVAELPDEEEEIILKEFDSEDEEKNFSDAKKYLADLVKILNGED